MSSARIGAGRPGPPALDAVPLMSSPLPVAIVVVDLDGRVVQANPAAATLLGGPRDGLRDLPLERSWPFAEAGRLARDADRGALVQEAAVPAPLGGEHRLRYSVTPVSAGGAGRCGFVVVAVDVTADRRREAAMESQRRAALAVALEQDPATALAAVARETAVLCGARSAGVVRFDGAEAVVVATAGPEGPAQGTDHAHRVPLARAGAVGEVERDGATHTSPPAPPGAPGVPWRPRVAERLSALPVRVAGGLWGVLWLCAPSAGPEPPAEGLTAMVDLAALVAGRTDSAPWEAGATMEAAFRGEHDARQALRVLTDSARRALGALRVTLHLDAAEGSGHEDLISAGAEPAARAETPEVAARLRSELPHWRRMIGRGEPAGVEVDDLRSDPRVATGLLATTDARTVMLRRVEAPAGTSDRPLGVLVVCWERPHRIGHRDRMVVATLAGLAGVALADDALAAGPGATVATARDPLTGLLTHRAFQERLGVAVVRALAGGDELSLAFLDIDRFRRVNEAHGHAVGDRVLADVAARLQAEANADDVLGRIGGEEFAWLSRRPGVELLNAVDRAREAVAEAEMGGVDSVTVSAGLCDLRQAGSRDELERFAEGALYWAKQHGRDVALAYTPEVVEVLSADERAEHLARSQALQSIRVLARAVDAKDPSTLRHSERVADLAVAIGTALGWGGERLVALREAGLVHDVGKIGVPDAILFKPARLSDGEYREIMRHVTIGAEILTDVLTAEQVGWVRGHHERWDGGGYPDGLAGLVIPDGARVLGLADAWDVMTSQRPYHEPLDPAAALAECHRCAGSQFAPEAVEAIERLVRAGVVPLPGT